MGLNEFRSGTASRLISTIGKPTSIALGMFIHIGVVTRMFPSTGMPLPLVSWGGSNLMVTIGTLGIVSRVASEGASA